MIMELKIIQLTEYYKRCKNELSEFESIDIQSNLKKYLNPEEI